MKYVQMVTPLMLLVLVGAGLVDLLSRPFTWWTPLALIGALFVIVYSVALGGIAWFSSGGGFRSDEGDGSWDGE